jgi:HPt (histidine-containing phosphotransfer) domain-containing protein
MIDWAQARQLQEDVGKEEMAEVVELFLSEVDEAMETLQNSYDTIPAEDRAAAFHFLKGCASNLGFKTFGDQCSLGEEITKGGGVPDFEISDLAAIYASSKQQFTGEFDAELG